MGDSDPRFSGSNRGTRGIHGRQTSWNAVPDHLRGEGLFGSNFLDFRVFSVHIRGEPQINTDGVGLRGNLCASVFICG
jgi:hypothetical protein